MEWLALVLFALIIAALLAGYPVAFTLAGVSLGFAVLCSAFGAFDTVYLEALPSRLFGTMQNQSLIAVPLFIFMGLVLERARIADELLETLGRVFGHGRGGLAIAVVVVGALLAASTGIVGATVVTMGLLSLPAMLKSGYDPRIATGTICASGTLGQIIPPSVILVLLGVATPQQLREARPYVIVGAFVVGAIMTPPDAMSQIMFAVPLWLLYELGVVVAALLQRQRPVEGADSGSGDDAYHPLTPEQMDAELDRIEAEEKKS